MECITDTTPTSGATQIHMHFENNGEKVQYAVTRWTPNLALLPYTERLKLSIPELTVRNNRGDLIQMCRIIYELCPTSVEQFIKCSNDSRLRGHS
ncbi:hypothetical protein BDFB_012325 [Asbolus verrucosus]|uniref:Uncharacterized protein n=1 Tax=Asbolus verrucosus TaxID=1661398 RepID=A0A482W4G1_ASBVE|nr:hypothetical protein BDFB_012325 [Asbolus verrucosus]